MAFGVRHLFRPSQPARIGLCCQSVVRSREGAKLEDAVTGAPRSTTSAPSLSAGPLQLSPAVTHCSTCVTGQQRGHSEVLWVPDPANVCSFTPPWAALGLMVTAMRFEWLAVGHTASEWENLFYGRFLSALKHAVQNPLTSCLNR